MNFSSAILLLSFTAAASAGDDPVFADDFKGTLGEGWTWKREAKESWRVTDSGLEVKIEPGNMWGPQNDAKNLLLRPVPEALRAAADVSVQVQHAPSHQWEQADLTWYYDDSHMVKIGLELVDGSLSIVMGREEKDRTRTIAIIPFKGPAACLRLVVEGKQIRGFYRTPDQADWTEAGKADLPLSELPPHVCLQFYQGEAGADRWATVTGFKLLIN